LDCAWHWELRLRLRLQRREAAEETDEQGADESAEEERAPRRDRGERGERGQGDDRGGREGFGGFRRPNPMFEAIDVNGDGTINNAELRKAIAALRKLDADGDGNITLAEATPQGGPGFRGGPFGGGGDPAQMVDGMIQNLDRNRDGQIGLDEVDERSLGMLSRFRDVNGDGKLSREELMAGMEQMRQQFGGGFGGGRGGFGGGGFDPQQMTERMMANDQNGDGKLQADEVPEQFRGMLRGADQNEDGAIDARELAESTRRMGERFGRGGFGRGGREGQEGGFGRGEEGGEDGERRGRRRPEAEE
jgi:Ca2+-binding EF-hand superfamily protein